MSITEPTTADPLRAARAVAQREANSGNAYSIRSTAPSPWPRLPEAPVLLSNVVLFAFAVLVLWYISGFVSQDGRYSLLIYQIGLVAVAFAIVINAVLPLALQTVRLDDRRLSHSGHRLRHLRDALSPNSSSPSSSAKPRCRVHRCTSSLAG
jgi:hypothetical protein